MLDKSNDLLSGIDSLRTTKLVYLGNGTGEPSGAQNATRTRTCMGGPPVNPWWVVTGWYGLARVKDRMTGNYCTTGPKPVPNGFLN